MTSLYLDPHAVRRMAEFPATDADDRYGAATAFATMLARAATSLVNKSSEPRAKEFLAWAFKHLIERKSQFSPSLLDATAEYVKGLLADMAPQDTSSTESHVLLMAIQRIARDLPDALGRRLSSDPDFMTKISLKSIRVGEAGRLRFEQSDFVTALTEAINGNTAKARVLGGTKSARFSPKDVINWAVDIDSGAETHVIVNGPLVGLLSRSAVQREAAAARLASKFDLGSTEHRAAIAELATTEDNEMRLRRAEEYLDRSAIIYYEKLEAKVKGGQGIAEADLLRKCQGFCVNAIGGFGG